MSFTRIWGIVFSVLWALVLGDLLRQDSYTWVDMLLFAVACLLFTKNVWWAVREERHD